MADENPNEKKERVLALLKRVNCTSPKKSDVEAFKRELQTNPNLLNAMSDLAMQAQQHLADNVRGNLIVTESVRHGIERTVKELGYANAGALERLLIDNVGLCWARLYLLEQQYTNVMAGSLSIEAAMYWERKLTMVQGRYLRAIETLARVRRLLRPTSPAMQVNIAQPGAQQLNAQVAKASKP